MVQSDYEPIVASIYLYACPEKRARVMTVVGKFAAVGFVFDRELIAERTVAA